MKTIRKPRKGASLEKILEYCKAYYKQGDEVHPVTSDGLDKTQTRVVRGEIIIWPHSPNRIAAFGMSNFLYCNGVYAEKIESKNLVPTLEQIKKRFPIGTRFYPVALIGNSICKKLHVIGKSDFNSIRSYSDDRISYLGLEGYLWKEGIFAKKLPTPGIKVGSWVKIKGTGHTKDNEYFPKGEKFKVKRISSDGCDKHVHVDHSSNPLVTGNSTYLRDVELTTPPKQKSIKKEKIMKSNYQKLEDLWVKQVDLKIGDYVKVLFAVPDWAQGWDNTFTSRMEECVGKTLRVKDFVENSRGILLELPNTMSTLGFPYFCLEKTTKPKPIVKLNDQYSAEVIDKTKVKVGCQEIPVSAIKQLLKEIENY